MCKIKIKNRSWLNIKKLRLNLTYIIISLIVGLKTKISLLNISWDEKWKRLNDI